MLLMTWILKNLLFISLIVSSVHQEPARDAAASLDRPADREAIRTTVKQLLDAFEKQDVAKITELLTDGAELSIEDNPSIIGKAAIEEALKRRFVSKAKQQMVLSDEMLRFTSQVTAVEEGMLKSMMKGQASSMHRYSLMHVKEDGKWKIAQIRQWTNAEAALLELDWLVGEWKAERADLSIHTTYEWVGNKAFIRGNINTRQKDRTISAMQVIGLDPKTGGLRIWIFEANGIFAEGTCYRDENSWIFETSGETPQGVSVSSKNILLHVSPEVMTWQPVQLRMGEEQIADLPPLKVTKVKK